MENTARTLGIGQKVKVTDQKSTAVGTIIGVSTWEKIGVPIGSVPCYLIRCQGWKELAWRDKSDLEVIEEK